MRELIFDCINKNLAIVNKFYPMFFIITLL